MEMLNNQTPSIQTNNKTSLNRWVYAILIVLGIFSICYKQAFMAAATNFGLALAFDPFDTKMPWQQRPIYQKIWLIAHLIIVFAIFIYGIIKN